MAFPVWMTCEMIPATRDVLESLCARCLMQQRVGMHPDVVSTERLGPLGFKILTKSQTENCCLYWCETGGVLSWEKVFERRWDFEMLQTPTKIPARHDLGISQLVRITRFFHSFIHPWIKESVVERYPTREVAMSFECFSPMSTALCEWSLEQDERSLELSFWGCPFKEWTPDRDTVQNIDNKLCRLYQDAFRVLKWSWTTSWRQQIFAFQPKPPSQLLRRKNSLEVHLQALAFLIKTNVRNSDERLEDSHESLFFLQIFVSP